MPNETPVVAASPSVEHVPLSLRWRLGLLSFIAFAAVTTCFWRTQAGHRYLPGLFTVICVPLSVAFFLLVDRRVHFGRAEWIAVTAVIAAHMALSVPAFPGPLYYRGTHLFRPDHFVHLFAGGLVAWLCSEMLERLSTRWHRSRWTMAAAAFILTMGFGAAKEVTDFLSVRASGLHYDAIDTLEDLSANALGATITVVWRLTRSPSRRVHTDAVG
jgi:hypothetical protein